MISGRFAPGVGLELEGGPDDRVRWDGEAGELIRDRAGAAGLFVGEHGGALFFAGEVRDLLGLLPRRPEPDPLAVAHYVSNTGIPDGRTLFAGIEAVLPGERIRLTRDGWKRERWWWPEPGPGPGERAPEDALLAEMQAAVDRAWDGAGNAAVLLSGGFDSGAVAALAAGRRPRTYSAVFPGHPGVDESERIRATRSMAGLDGHEDSYEGGRSALEAAVEYLLEWQVPPVSPNGFIWRPLIRRAAADGVDTMVDGEGGDEMFGAARYLIADALRRGRLGEARSLARRVTGMGGDPKPRWVRQALVRYGLRGALPPGLHRALRRLRGSPPRTSPLLRKELADLHRQADDEWAWKRVSGPRWRARLTHLTVLHSEALGASDAFRREAALSGMRFRHPFRDPELLQAVLGFDPSLMFDPHIDRPLARTAMAGLLPDEVRLDDHKPHFNVLLDEALAGVDRPALRELLGPDARCREYLELPDGFADLDPAAGPRAGIELFRVAMLEYWLRLAEDMAHFPYLTAQERLS